MVPIFTTLTSVEKALSQSRDRGGDKKPLKTVKKKQVSFLKKYIDTIRGQLSRNQRAKIVALVTIEVHARDVIDLLIKKGEFDENSFAWLQQLRLYWDRKIDDCLVRQTNTQFQAESEIWKYVFARVKILFLTKIFYF